MNVIRSGLKSSIIEVVTKYRTQFRPTLVSLPTCTKCYSTMKQNTKEQSSKDDDFTDEPFKYSESLASKWRASDSRRGRKKSTRPEKESDIDEELGKNLYSRIDGLEEVQLQNALRHNKEMGLDTKEIINRLEELENEKKL